MKKTIVISLCVLAVIAAAIAGRGLYRRYKYASDGIYEEGEFIDDKNRDYTIASKIVFDSFQYPVWANQKLMEKVAFDLNSWSENDLKNLYNVYKTIYNQDVFSVIESRLCVGCKAHKALVKKITQIKRPSN
jgi:hypothetical protein